MDRRHRTGARGEELAAAYLTGRGFTLLARNARVGRDELDVVARKGGLVVFCEVRARRSDRVVDPVYTIDERKIGRVRRAASAWLRRHPQGPVQIRFDAAAIVFDTPEGRLRYYEAAF